MNFLMFIWKTIGPLNRFGEQEGLLEKIFFLRKHCKELFSLLSTTFWSVCKNFGTDFSCL